MRAHPLPLLWLLSVAPLAGAAPNDSGQSRCYDGQDLVACTPATAGDEASFPRQDGRFGRDAQRLGFALEPRDEAGAPAAPGAPAACVRDRVSGLLWRARPGAPAAWERLPALVAELNARKACGRSDWRMPARTELVSVVSYGRFGPAIEAPFAGVAAGPCWAAEPTLGEPKDRAWAVHLMDGSSFPSPRTAELQWLAVAGGPPAKPRHEPLDDGTVRDARTGLVWDRCTFGQTGADCERGTPTRHPWAAALKLAVKASRERYKGHDDWRLPSVKELEALADVGRSRPAVDPAAFPRIQNAWYWSSTPRVANTDFGEVVQAWDVGLDDAHIGFGLEDLSGYVILVRNAGGYDALAAPARPAK